MTSPSPPLDSLSAIRRLRKAGLAMSEIATRSKVRRTTLDRIARGEDSHFRQDTRAKLAALVAEVEAAK